MRSYIVIGNTSKREEFLNEYIKKENIPEYSITYFKDGVKIEEAKLIRQILSKKYSQKYLIVITSPLNHIAQNSLLKSIEELQENISIVISLNNLGGILDTLKSRFFLVDFKDSDTNNDAVISYSHNNLSEVFMTVDKFLFLNSSLSTEEQIDKFIKEYRKDLLTSLNTFEKKLLVKRISTLKKLLAVSNLIKNNNVNLRFGLETALL